MSRRMRRNGSDYHVLGPGGALLMWTGADATPEIRRGEPFTLTYPSHQSADEVAAGVVGEGYVQWAAVMNPEHLPVSYATRDGDTLVLTAAERYGVTEESVYDALCKSGNCPTFVRRMREAALAKGAHTPEERQYGDALMTAWEISLREGRVSPHSGFLGFFGPTFEYGKRSNGYEMVDPVSLGSLEIVCYFTAPARFSAFTSERTRSDNYLMVVSKPVFEQVWHALMDVR